MKRRLSLCLAILLLQSGCETNNTMTELPAGELAKEVSTLGLRNNTPIPEEAEKLLLQSTPCCPDYSAFTYRELKTDSTQTVVMDGSFPSFQFPGGKSFFIAFRLPATNRPLSIEVQSIAAPDRVFAPELLILTSDYQVARQIGADYFQYQSAGFLKGERLEAKLVDIGGFKDETFLIVYSSPASRSGSTTLVHPAKQFARSQNRVEPDIPDPVAKHSPLGVITVFATTGQPAEQTSKPLNIPKGQERAPEIFINEKIKQAVAEGRIEEAMQLVEDAEANGSTTARRAFIDAVKDQQQQ
jgi:maltose operon protein